MSKNIVGRHINLSDSIKKYISDGIDELNKYQFVEIISTSTIVSRDNTYKSAVLS